MKRANTMSTITVELTIKVKTKFTSSNAEKTNEKTNGFISRMSEIFTLYFCGTSCQVSPSVLMKSFGVFACEVLDADLLLRSSCSHVGV